MPITIVNEPDEGWEGVLFTMEPDDPEHTIGFLRTLEPDEEDVKLGHDKVCVTYYGASAYGCVRAWEQVDLSAIRVRLTPEAAAALDVDEVTEFECDDVDDNTEGFEAVRRMLLATGELVEEA